MSMWWCFSLWLACESIARWGSRPSFKPLLCVQKQNVDLNVCGDTEGPCQVLGCVMMCFSAFLAKSLWRWVQPAGIVCHQCEEWLGHLRCAGAAVTGQSCHCKTPCSAVHALLIRRCSFSSNYLRAIVTPKQAGTLLSSNNYWYLWEK